MRIAAALFAAGAAGAASVGDRLVLEHSYQKSYSPLPTTAAEAAREGWSVPEACHNGLGRRAEGGRFSNSTLHIWYDRAGALMGYGAKVRGGVVAPPWTQVDGGYELNLLFRDPAHACSRRPTAVPGSIGDRLLLAVGGATHPLPLTLSEANSSGYTDTGSCWPNMGYHMIYPGPSGEVSPLMPMYTGSGAQLTGALISGGGIANAADRNTPPFEYFEAFAAFSLHMYFIDTGSYPNEVCTM